MGPCFGKHEHDRNASGLNDGTDSYEDQAFAAAQMISGTGGCTSRVELSLTGE